MRFSTYFKFTPFSELPRSKQCDEYLNLHAKIKKHQDQNGPNFWCDCKLHEEDRPALYDQIMQFQFLGNDGYTIWNAILSTAARDYWERISELACDAADAALTPEDKAKHNEFMKDRNWLTPNYSAQGRVLNYSMRKEEPYASHGTRTRHDWMAEYEENLIKNDTGTTAPVYESFHIDPEFEYGIGLYTVMDVDTINATTIETMIAKFRAIGEKDWQADTPVPHARLPKKTFDALCREIQDQNGQTS